MDIWNVCVYVCTYVCNTSVCAVSDRKLLNFGSNNGMRLNTVRVCVCVCVKSSVPRNADAHSLALCRWNSLEFTFREFRYVDRHGEFTYSEFSKQ
jgi:hypothetical protein